jgi:hypothetical protein
MKVGQSLTFLTTDPEYIVKKKDGRNRYHAHADQPLPENDCPTGAVCVTA